MEHTLRKHVFGLALAGASAMLVACGGGSTPSAIPTASPAPKQTASPSPKPTASPTPTPTTGPNSQMIFVADRTTNAILGFAANASGNAAPTIDITSSASGFGPALSLAMSANGTMYEAGDSTDYINVFNWGDNGNISPDSWVQNSNPVTSEGVAVDSSGNMYESSYSFPCEIDEYAAGSSGTMAPTNVLSGANTQLTFPTDMAFDSRNRLYVGQGGSSILIFAAGATGNVAPVATIAGSNTTLTSVTAMSFDAAGRLLVADASGKILVFAAGATGNATPVQTISGSNTGLSAPSGVAEDAQGGIWVSDNGSSPNTTGLYRFSKNANGNVAPISTIKGAATLLVDPFYVQLH